MDNAQTPEPLPVSDYEAIEAAVMETEKGRWFLAEFARRNRSADTGEVLVAVARLEKLLQRERRPDIDRIRLDVGEMKDAIERTKSEIAQLKHDSGDGTRFMRATNELDSIVTQTETATSEILGAAEKLQEIAFILREAKVEPEACDAIEGLIMQIYTACSFQDLTGQRTQKVVHVLRYLEGRINSMIDIWGLDGSESTAAAAPVVVDSRPDAHLLNGPALEGEGIDQSQIDSLMDAAATIQAPEGDADAAMSVDDFEFDAVDFDAIGFDTASDTIEAAAPVAHVEPVTAGAATAAIDHDDIMALDRVVAEDLGTDWGGDGHDDGLATQLAAEMAAAEDAVEDELFAVDVDVDAVIAEATAAMDEAIETLKDVSGAVSERSQDKSAATDNDPLASLGRAERQALFS
jgi:hypothetical protein